jgi:hypothetical protein
LTFYLLGGDNIALNKSADESLSHGEQWAMYANDGNFDTSNIAKCAGATTPGDGTVSWWRVDLGNTYYIFNITVYIPAAYPGKF